MKKINEDITAYLEKVVKEEREAHHDGTIDACMETTGHNDPDMFGLCAMSTGGDSKNAGQADEIFPLESSSKALSLLLALEDIGAEELFRYVGKEPTGDQYHSITPLEDGKKGFPSNPMVNPGAILVTSKIRGRDGDERFARLLDFIRILADNPRIDYNRKMLEMENKDLNRSLFYFMRSHGAISGSEEDSLVPYLKQTCIEMTCCDLARIGAVMANQGRDPVSGYQLIQSENVRLSLILMLTTGMYDASGTFAVDVGLPSKSGISGAILTVVPGRMGIGSIGPSLDSSGNSIAGVRILQKLAARWKLGVFS